MHVVATVHEVRALRQDAGAASWGLVPTMGFLHDGHLALVSHARAASDHVAVSIFVNPTQFAPDEDLATYPRALARDLEMLAGAGVDLVFTPQTETLYPSGFQTWVTVERLTAKLEGAARPTHFRGVTTIVAKLFNIIQPARAYFGQKDVQQTIVLRRMVADLNMPVELVVVPTVREADGLAMSSRNSNLTPSQRAAAPILHRALEAAATAVAAGERDGDALRQLLHDTVAAEPLARTDYVSATNPDTLDELTTVEDAVLFSLAVYIGQTRLIDNRLVAVEAPFPQSS